MHTDEVGQPFIHAGSALPRVHSTLSVLAARDRLPGLANVLSEEGKGGREMLESVTTSTEAILCNLFCLCRRAQLDPAAVAACPPVLMTFLWILLSFDW